MKNSDVVAPYLSGLPEALACEIKQVSQEIDAEGWVHSPISGFVSQINKQSSSFLGSLSSKTLTPIDQLTPLSGEAHWDGSFVVRDESCNSVIYPGQRAFPNVLVDVCRYFGNELGLSDTAVTESFELDEKGIKSRSFVEQTAITDPSLASFQSGILIAIAQLTSTTDLHRDNLVFNNNCPVLIDTETCVQPLRSNQKQALSADRVDFPHSPFRSMLLTDVPDRFAATGLRRLFEHPIDSWTNDLIEGYESAAAFISSKQASFDECVRCSLECYPYVRYLPRSTPVYYELKKWVGILRFNSTTENDIKDQLKNFFGYETSLYPELNFLIIHEIKQLMNGITPYWVLDSLSGEISSGVDLDPLGKIKPTAWDWFRENLSKVLNTDMQSNSRMMVRAIQQIQKGSIIDEDSRDSWN